MKTSLSVLGGGVGCLQMLLLRYLSARRREAHEFACVPLPLLSRVGVLGSGVGRLQMLLLCSPPSLLHLQLEKVDTRLPGKGKSNSRGARPVYSFR